MKPERESKLLLGVTRSQAKMIEYNVPFEHRIKISQDPAKLFTLSIAILGDLAAGINRNNLPVDELNNMRRNLIFSAQFFDAYFQSELDINLDPYLVVLGSASYYLCDLPGSSTVLSKNIMGECPDLDGEGLEKLLVWLLHGNINDPFNSIDGPFGDQINSIVKTLKQYFSDGEDYDRIFSFASDLRNKTYLFGTPRQLLFGDVASAVLKKKIENSSWYAIPKYSNLSKETWLSTLQKDIFIKELWPAQHLIGKAKVFTGDSVVIQMPTSAGKTKAVELIIRSAFLSKRASLAIVVAPFRALCQEIKNSFTREFRNEPIVVDEMSDVLQADYVIMELLGHQQILITTPEKLLYVLRHTPELAQNIGLIIFDEGHQFDSGSRGVTYELLLTSLRSMLPIGTQKILISAVISNAPVIGDWLNGTNKVVEGSLLNPTYKSIGFVSWQDKLGRIEFVSNEDNEKGEFFVPRIIESIKLNKMPRERIERYFPVREDGKEVALYLGLKLSPNGGVAIFCGQRSAVVSICEKVVSIFDRGVSLPIPRDYSAKSEVMKLYYLHVKNLGESAIETKSALLGVYSHQRNTPHGIRLAVEHAMHKGLIRFVICTSTLAQGVNLPIRYLIVTSIYQGAEKIKVRDFHNLIGRTGRAGISTEGSVIFADPIIYDKRRDRKEFWKWKQVKVLLEPKNTEPCLSSLLSIFEPLLSDNGKFTIAVNAIDFANTYFNDPQKLNTFAQDILNRYGEKGFTIKSVENQFKSKIDILSSIESFLLSHWDDKGEALSEVDVIQLSEETLAYFISEKSIQDSIRDLFIIISRNISNNILDEKRRIVYGKTLYGCRDNKLIEDWINNHKSDFSNAIDSEQILELIWPLLQSFIKNSVFKKFSNQDLLIDVARNWIRGKSYHEIFEIVKNKNVKLMWGSTHRVIEINHIVDLCENGFAYDGTLLVGAIIELISLFEINDLNIIKSRFQIFQKQLKYGLPKQADICVFESGFSD